MLLLFLQSELTSERVMEMERSSLNTLLLLFFPIVILIIIIIIYTRYRYMDIDNNNNNTGIAMAATLGMLVQENYHFSGFLSPSAALEFSSVPNGLAALDVVPLAGWVQMAVVIGMHEVLVKQREGKAPGDFGTGYFGVALDDQSATQLRALNVEVQNGRLYVNSRCTLCVLFIFCSCLL